MKSIWSVSSGSDAIIRELLPMLRSLARSLWPPVDPVLVDAGREGEPATAGSPSRPASTRTGSTGGQRLRARERSIGRSSRMIASDPDETDQIDFMVYAPD